MSEQELLQWVRGPAFEAASVIFVIGVLVRLLQTVLLGRSKDLSEARGSEVIGGLRTIFTRSVKHNFQLSTFNLYTMVAGYIFHIGFFVVLLLYAPHILVIDQVMGVSWPSLPTTVVDAVTVVTIVSLLAILVHRLKHPVLRFLSRFQDYFVWVVTILPLITGYLAFHRIGASPPTLIAIHILSVELLMVVFPFTKLIHAFTLFMARYYNGAFAGRRGVES
jgi:nitrate reductase gamma subunit